MTDRDQNPGDGITYADAGVDLDAASEVVELMRPALAKATRPEVLGSIGGFGGLFGLNTDGMEEPVLVSSTDGVGTKIELAKQLDILDGVGRDLVAMVVDDLVATGAEPLFFNDYISVGRLDPKRVARIVTGIAKGCELAGCALIGGETAEHRGLMDDDEFDLAGFGVGIVDRPKILSADLVRPRDALIAFASSGAHSNGYTLIRKIVADADLSTDPIGAGRSLADVLLEPTRIHARTCVEINRSTQVDVRAWCHITGGGLVENLPRVLPASLGVVLDRSSWQVPELFNWLAQTGPVAEEEMWRVFNMGVGMVGIVDPLHVDSALAIAREAGEEAWQIGHVVERDADRPRVDGL